MWRAWLEVAVPFLLPFALYFAYLAIRSQQAQGNGAAANDIGDGAGNGGAAAAASGPPWLLMTVIGLALAAGVLFYTAFTGGGRPGDAYVPTRVEDGRRVPAEFQPRR
ncbi:MAG: hypothetical protein IT557_10455 [Alphaproteobacteria bacterium]|nr:hypothetical protein [Alphaproteobacteria bacterium]